MIESKEILEMWRVRHSGPQLGRVFDIAELPTKKVFIFNGSSELVDTDSLHETEEAAYHAAWLDAINKVTMYAKIAEEYQQKSKQQARERTRVELEAEAKAQKRKTRSKHEWCANSACEICARRKACEDQSYADLAASGGIVDAP